MARTAEQIAEGKRAWRRANPGYKRAWYARNREHACAEARAWRSANLEHATRASRAYYLTHKDQVLEYSRMWRKANPEAKKAAQQRRRADGYVSTQDLKDVQAMSDGLCSYCLTAGLRLTLDHVWPISRGGTNAPENLVMACVSCNASKNDRSLVDLLMLRQL